MIVVGIILALFYGPLLFVVLKAFHFEQTWSLHWFKILFEDPQFWTALRNSFVVAIISSGLSVALALLAVLHNPGKKTDRLMLLSLSFPEIILSLSLLSLFVLFQIPLGMTTLMIGHTTLTLSFAYLILRNQMQKLDLAIVESAQDLGASEAQIRSQILVPWLKEAVLSSFLLALLLSLDDFLITFFISGIGQTTLPIQLFSMLKTGLSPKINALSFLILSFSMVALVAFYFYSKRGKKIL